MISCSSSFASSTPATSLNVTTLSLWLTSRARLLPKERALLLPPCTWRNMKNQNTPKMSTRGTTLTRNVNKRVASGSSDHLMPFSIITVFHSAGNSPVLNSIFVWFL